MIDDETVKNKPIRLPKKAERVKNKAPAQFQITAEQLLREAKECELEIVPPAPKVKITDPEELAEFQRKKRKEFEDNIRKNRSQIANWVKYAKLEESIGEPQRVRSVFERSLDVDHRSITLWLQYAEMKMRNKQINHARNIWDRAITILLMATQFWLKYSYMEELIETLPRARQVFERWVGWEPSEHSWQTYINFELLYKEIDRARNIFHRFLHIHGHDYRNWIRYAKFEESHGFIGNARESLRDKTILSDIKNAAELLAKASKEPDRMLIVDLITPYCGYVNSVALELGKASFNGDIQSCGQWTWKDVYACWKQTLKSLIEVQHNFDCRNVEQMLKDTESKLSFVAKIKRPE